jgi:hypothetical protein
MDLDRLKKDRYIFQTLLPINSQMALERCNKSLIRSHYPSLTMETLININQDDLQNGKLCDSFPIGLNYCCMARK